MYAEVANRSIAFDDLTLDLLNFNFNLMDDGFIESDWCPSSCGVPNTTWRAVATCFVKKNRLSSGYCMTGQSLS